MTSIVPLLLSPRHQLMVTSSKIAVKNPDPLEKPGLNLTSQGNQKQDVQVERHVLHFDLNCIKRLTEQTELGSKFQSFGLLKKASKFKSIN